jgi:hypothetical protein
VVSRAAMARDRSPSEPSNPVRTSTRVGSLVKSPLGHGPCLALFVCAQPPEWNGYRERACGIVPRLLRVIADGDQIEQAREANGQPCQAARRIFPRQLTSAVRPGPVPVGARGRSLRPPGAASGRPGPAVHNGMDIAAGV